MKNTNRILEHQINHRDVTIMIWRVKNSNRNPVSCNRTVYFTVGNRAYETIRDAKADIDDWYNETQGI